MHLRFVYSENDLGPAHAVSIICILIPCTVYHDQILCEQKLYIPKQTVEYSLVKSTQEIN